MTEDYSLTAKSSCSLLTNLPISNTAEKA